VRRTGCWLAVESALAADDIEEAYHHVQDFGGVAVVDTSGHPGAPALRDVLTVAGRRTSGWWPARRTSATWRPDDERYSALIDLV
jgi:hypothetical protein